MSTHANNERGAALIVELVVLAIVLAAAGFAGYQYLSHKTATNPATKSKPHEVAKASPSPSQTPSTTVVFGATVPSDFGAYITGIYNTQKQTCANTTFSISQAVVRDEFAVVNENCDTGSAVFYAKVNGQWQEAFGTQNVPNCADVNKYSFTKVLVQQCWGPNNALVNNTNP